VRTVDRLFRRTAGSIGVLAAASLLAAPLAAAQGSQPPTSHGQPGSSTHGTGSGGDDHTDHTDHDDQTDHGAKGKGGRGKGAAGSKRGQAGARSPGVEESLRGKGAGAGGEGARGGAGGSSQPGRGQLYGDMWVVLRDANGVPILTPEGFRQPLDADGQPVPLDAEGKPLDESRTVPVELGRLNVSRSPSQVLDGRLEEAARNLQAATAVRRDEAGRLVFTIDGVEKTIDSPLENLAIYRALMTTGSIPGLTDLPGADYDFLVDGRQTPDDLRAAASFLAGAADKYDPIRPDSVAYLNTILQISLKTTGDVTYSGVEFSGFSYDRAAAYAGQTTQVIVKQPDGTLKVETVDLFEKVFGSQPYAGRDSISAYAQAADDARAVIAFTHDNGPPEEAEGPKSH
jgi:hypothetical protein